MKVIYVAAYYTRHYVRQDVIRQSLKSIHGLEVVECIRNAPGFWRYVNVLWRFAWLPKKDVDVVIVGWRGHELMPFVRLLTRKPVIFDAFISLYDTLCFDRKNFSPRSLLGRLAFWLDRHDCKIADHILLDTNEHIRYFSRTFGIRPEKCSCVYVGADDRLFHPVNQTGGSDRIDVFYYGTTLPVHGVDVLLRAIQLLRYERTIRFRLAGPIRDRYGSLIDQLKLRNAEFIPWVPYRRLAEEIGRADICLAGHFSGVEKARRVIPGKAYQFAAMGKPIILGDNPANREVFTDGQDCVMVKMDSPESLAQGVLRLSRDRILREAVAKKGRVTYEGVQKTILSQLTKVLDTYARP